MDGHTTPDFTVKTFVLTRVNGSQCAIVIQRADVGFDLEDLAAANAGTFNFMFTGLGFVGLAALSMLLLIAASGISETIWFLLAVDGLGILQNAYVTGATRSLAGIFRYALRVRGGYYGA